MGLAARPLGAVICGYLGDKFGRRILLLFTVSIMGCRCFLLGCPTYWADRIWAPLLSGHFAHPPGLRGANRRGAQLMTLEHAPEDLRGKYSGAARHMFADQSDIGEWGDAGAVIAAFSRPDFYAYGWRIPFLLSIMPRLGRAVHSIARQRDTFICAFFSTRKSPKSAVHYVTYLDCTSECIPCDLHLLRAGRDVLYLVVIFSLSYITAHFRYQNKSALLNGRARRCAIVGGSWAEFRAK